MERGLHDPEDHPGKVQCTRSFVYKETSGWFRLAVVVYTGGRILRGHRARLQGVDNGCV